MHSTTGQTSSTVSSSSTSTPSSASTTTTNNIEQYHYPPISTLRRPSRPSNIDLSVFDIDNNQQSNDPGIYSAPICHLKQANNTNHHHHHHHPHHIQQSSLILSPHPHTATFHYQPQQQQQQHIQLSSHLHQQQQHNIHQYQQQTHHPQQQQQQQPQQHLLDPFSQHQHTPHTFPLQTSSNHYHHYFHFPPATQNLGSTNNSTPAAYNQLTLQANVTSNGHHSPLNHRSNPVSSSTTNTSQPSTPTHNNRLLAVQIQEQQQWSNPVLSPLMVKRINEGGNVVTSMHIDDDEDPSASIDALVADVDSSSHDLLDDQQNKSIDENKTISTIPLTESRASTTSPSAHLYLRSTSHILTTPPNPLASNDHPDNQLTVGNNFQKTFSPIHSAGFELTTNNSVQIPSTATTRTSFFTFDTNVLEENNLKKHLNEENKEDNQEKMIKPLIINTDERTNTISTNSLSQDDNSNHSSTNSNSQSTSSRTLSQILQSSGEKNRLSSSSPLSTDIKLSPLDRINTKSQTNNSSLSPSQQGNRHYCTHPDCAKIFANKSALAKHKLTHCQDRKHKCLKCNKGFKRLDHLHGHMLTHEEEKPHKCRVPDCNRTYCDARSLKRHIENAHQNILAAIHEGGHDEYRTFLPETAFVKTKELSSDFSIDSIESNSPRSSSIDNEQSFHMNQQIRSSNGQKMMPTYTFDEEKCVECHICKKSFKNGAALNGHMRLHGGFNEKQSLPSSTDNTQKKKRLTPPLNNERRQIKRKRPNSPPTSTISNQRPILQRSMQIKNEEEDIMMISSPSNPNHHHHHHQHSYQQTMYPTLPPCSDVLQHRFYDRSLSSRTRSISSSVVQPQTSPLTHYNIKNPLSVQPVTNLPKSTRKQIPLPSHFYDRNNNHYYGFDIHTNEEAIHNRINLPNHGNNSLNIPPGILRFDHLTNPQMFANVATIQPHEEKIRKTLSADETLKYYHHERQVNGLSPSKHSPNYPYFRSMSNQHHSTNFSPLSVPSPPTSTITPNLFHHILRHTNDIFNKEFYLPRPEHHPTLDEPIRYTPSTSPYATHVYHSPSPRIVHSPADKIPNPTSSVINTPVTSPYSNLNPSRCSPASVDMYNNTSGMNSMQPSPLTNSTSSLAAPKKRILNALKQEAQDEQQNHSIAQDFSPIIEQTIDQDKQQTLNLDNPPEYPSTALTLKIVPEVDSPIVDSTKKTTTTTTSGFLIKTPSSSSTTNSSSTSSTSSNTHFNYENLPQIIPSKISENNATNSSFQWPLQISQFRRQQTLHVTNQTVNPLPTTPYTPPPMLSPFRKGPGLYYHVFSQTTPAAQQTSAATTPVLPYTPIPDGISGPKINIGKDYQADIPKLQMKINDDDPIDNDDLLFSPSQLPYLDENALEKYEELSRTNPLLFSPRHSPTLYPIELVYMLLHEYNGDLQRTLAALLDGTAQDIKQCRPLHRYHFPECDTWTKEEIDAFTKAMEISEKNFILISRAVGTKTVKQCIEFHYMPKVNLTNRETGINSLTAKRKRLQMIKNRQQVQKQLFDDDTSSSSLNEFRLDDESDNYSTTIFSCDIDDCLQTFTSERAYRAHRNDHRRIKNNRTSPINIKRNRNLDLNK